MTAEADLLFDLKRDPDRRADAIRLGRRLYKKVYSQGEWKFHYPLCAYVAHLVSKLYEYEGEYLKALKYIQPLEDHPEFTLTDNYARLNLVEIAYALLLCRRFGPATDRLNSVFKSAPKRGDLAKRLMLFRVSSFAELQPPTAAVNKKFAETVKCFASAYLHQEVALPATYGQVVEIFAKSERSSR